MLRLMVNIHYPRSKPRMDQEKRSIASNGDHQVPLLGSGHHLGLTLANSCYGCGDEGCRACISDENDVAAVDALVAWW